MLTALTLLLCAPTFTAEAKKVVYENGDSYDGKWKQGAPNGVGTMIYANGDCYVGSWMLGDISGNGIMTYVSGAIYDGEWRDNQYEGHGAMTYPNGDSYDGTWIKSKRAGQGRMVYKNGDIYEGTWDNINNQDQGVMTYANGDRFEGERKNGELTSGTMAYSNGDKYSGEWSDGLPKNGSMTYVNGDYFKGEWRDSQLYNGDGKVTTTSYSFNGEWRNGKVYSGKGVMNTPDCIFEGEWLDGNLYNGHGKATIDDNFYDGEWYQGCFTGKCTLKFDSSNNLLEFKGEKRPDKTYQGVAKYKDNLIYEGSLDDEMQRTGSAKLKYDGARKSELIGEWDGEKCLKGNGWYKIEQNVFTIECVDPSLNLYDIKVYDKSGAEIYADTILHKVDYILSTFVLDIETKIKEKLQVEFFNKYLNDAFFAIDLADFKEKRDVSAFLDLGSLNLAITIRIENAKTLCKYQIAYVHKNRIRSYDRGYLIQQTSFADKLIENIEDITYSIDGFDIIFNGERYTYNPQNNTLYDNQRKVTMKEVNKDFIDSITENSLF